jgi:hypothetical protein
MEIKSWTEDWAISLIKSGNEGVITGDTRLKHHDWSAMKVPFKNYSGWKLFQLRFVVRTRYPVTNETPNFSII